MGTIYSIHCKECEYSKLFFTGHGMLDYSEYEFPQLINEDGIYDFKRSYKRKTLFERIICGYHGKEIRKILKSHPIEEWKSSEVSQNADPYYCPQCRKITPRKTSVIWRGFGETYEEYVVPQFCYKCKGKLILAEEMGYIDGIKCPRCGSSQADFGWAGYWD